MKCNVISLTYNRAELLSYKLGSLVGQTLPHDRFEVPVVDGGSNDATGAVAHEAAETPLAVRGRVFGFEQDEARGVLHSTRRRHNREDQ
jgi:glycosyltransferase involved in cell wall biosynthesis